MTGRVVVVSVGDANVSDNFSRSVCKNRVGHLHEGFSGGACVEESQLAIQNVAYILNRDPVTENILVMFKILGLVSFRDVDRLGASDVDNVGVQDIRKDCEAHLLERSVDLEEGFNLLFCHWDGADRRLRWTSGGGLYTYVHAHVQSRQLAHGDARDDPRRQETETAC